MATRNRPHVGRRTTIVVAGTSLLAASPFLINFLEKWESSGKQVLTVYADRLAGGLPTVCNGLTRHVTKTPIIVGQKWTKEKCDLEEANAVITMQETLARCFKIAPPQMVFDMASSHGWNNGPTNTCSSIAMTEWNAGNWEEGCKRLATSVSGKPVWSSVRTGKLLPNGRPEYKFVQGLANRRKDEASYCQAYEVSVWESKITYTWA